MTATPPIPDIDKTIVHAVNARIEAEVFAALAGDEAIGAYVAAALAQTVEVPSRRGYGKEQVPFMHTVLTSAIQTATAEAVRRVINDELPTIEAEVSKALRRNVRGIAEGLAVTLKDAADKAYGVTVNLDLKMPNRGD